MKVAVTGLFGAFLLFYVITSPDQAASIVHNTWGHLDNMAHGIRKFVDKLAG